MSRNSSRALAFSAIGSNTTRRQPKMRNRSSAPSSPRIWAVDPPTNNEKKPLEQIGDGVPVAAHCGDVVAERTAGDAVEVAALVIVGQGQVRDADRFPEPHLLAP